MFTYFISILLFAGLTLWGFFSPAKAAMWFLCFALCFAAWLLLVLRTVRSKSIYLNLNSFTSLEYATFRKYALYFTLPYQARIYSSICTAVSILALVWVAWLLWCSEWLLAGYFVAVFISAAFTAPFINPSAYLRFYATRDKQPHDLEERFAILQAVEEKVIAARGIF